jgi:hypothetical protein
MCHALRAVVQLTAKGVEDAHEHQDARVDGQEDLLGGHVAAARVRSGGEQHEIGHQQGGGVRYTRRGSDLAQQVEPAGHPCSDLPGVVACKERHSSHRGVQASQDAQLLHSPPSLNA